MKEFWISLNTKVYFGCGILEKRLAEIESIGSRILIVTGRRSAKATGLLSRIDKVLIDKKIKFFEFCEVEENPSFQTLEKGAEIARKNKCDCILGAGGGSSMDTAKGIAVLAVNDLPSKQYAGEDKFKNTPLPVAAIPTTAGTGSEITRFAVIVDKEENTKKTIASLSIMPRMAICDPELTLTLSPHLTASTGVDAISHAVEGYLSVRANPVSNVLGLEAMRLAVTNLEKAFKNGGDIEARSNMLLSSLIAGMALNHTGTILGHGMGYVLTLDFKMQHGEANGLMLPYLLEHIYSRKKERIDKIASALGGCPWEVLKNLLMQLSLPVTLSEIGVNKAGIDTILKRMIENSTRSLRNIDFPFGEQDFREIIEAAL